MSPGRSVSFPLPFSLSFSLRKSRARRLGREPWAALPPGVSRAPPAPSCSWGSRGPAQHLSRLPGPPGEGAGPGRGGVAWRSRGRGRTRAWPAEPEARSSREARWPHVTPAQLVLERWLPLARSGRPLRPPPASSSAACRRRRLLLHHCIMLRARRQRTAES